MCKYSSSHRDVEAAAATGDSSSGITINNQSTIVESRRLLPAAATHLQRGGVAAGEKKKFRENRETPEHIRSSGRQSPGGDRNKEKMFQQKLVIVIRTFLLFFLFQPSSLVATTVEAGEYCVYTPSLKE